MFPFFCSPTLLHRSAPLASCGYCSHLDSRATSPSLSVLCVSLQEGAPCLSFSLPFFSLCPPISPHPLSLALLVLLAVFLSLSPTLLSGKCRSFPDKFLVDWKRSKASGDHQDSSAKKCVGMVWMGRRRAFNCFFSSFFFFFWN